MCPIVPTFTCGLLRSNFSFAIFPYALVVPVKFVELLAQRQVHCLQRRQIKFAYLRLIAHRQRVIQLPRRCSVLRQLPVRAFQQLLAQHAIEIADRNSLALQQPEKIFYRARRKNPRQSRTKLLKLVQLFDAKRGLLKRYSRFRLFHRSVHWSENPSCPLTRALLSSKSWS